MKLMIMIIRDSDAENVVQELIGLEYRVTRMASTGGFLRRGNITLLVGVENDRVDHVIDILKRVCIPAEDNVHRATVFVSDMPYFTQI